MAYLDPTMSGTQEQARSYLNQERRARGGQDFSDQEFQQLAGQIGYTGGNVTGAQVNSAMDVLGWGSSPGATGVPLPASGPSTPQPGTQQQTQPQPTALAATTPTTTQPNTINTTQQQTAGVDPQQALTSVQSAFQTKFGRAMNDSEIAGAMQIAQQAGWNGQGPVPQAAIDAVMNAMGTYNPGGAQPGAPGAQPGQPTPTPAGSIDPAAAQQQVTQAFMQRFGKQPTPQELQWLIQMSGYSGSGPVPQEVMTRAMDAVARYTGNMQEPVNVTTPSSPAESAANSLLEELLKKEWGTVDLNAPENRGRIQAFERAKQRDTDRKRAALAERAAARGGMGAGGFDVDTERLLSEQGEAEQAFEADLTASALADQKQQMMQALQLALQTGQTEKARELQEKLGQLDIDLRRYLGRGQLALGLLNAQNQNTQFYDTLGLNYAQLQNLMNNQAMQSMFAGGY